MRILAVDIGAGTQDILLYDTDKQLENCIKMVLPSPSPLLAAQVGAATERGEDLFISGRTVGGGAFSRALKRHLASGRRVYITPGAAYTLRNNLDDVTSLGVDVREEPPPGFDGTAIEGRKINNPDSDGVGYIAVHGIPRRMIGEAASFLEPVRAARDRRNREMVDRLGAIAERCGVRGPVFSEVRDLSRAREGGSITERHILYAFALRIIERTGRGCLLCDFLSEEMGLDLPDRIRGYLEDPDNPHYVYDLLGVLKSSFLKEIYLQPGADECRPVAEVIELSERIGAISAYAYLGDVTESPTGDKKAERFEDGYLDELFDVISSLGFRAVTYMPPRNTVEQLRRVRRLCREHGLMEISGVDINSSRQSFNCPEILRPDFEHLIDAAWALIAHEKLSDGAPRHGLFDRRNPLAGLSLDKRIAAYARAGRELDHHKPWDTAAAVKHLEDPV